MRGAPMTVALAVWLAGAAAAGEEPATPPDGEPAPAAALRAPQDGRVLSLSKGAAADEAALAAVEAFELLVKEPYDPERAFSLVNRRELRDPRCDIKWPLAHAFALARAGESLRAASELERLARRLREGVGLDVQGLKLVTKVEAFGVYEEDGRQLLRPGDRVMAYADVLGFTCEPERERWRVSLEVEFTLENLLTGECVATWGPDEVEHATRSLVHDLHVTRAIRLPDDLAPGEYELELEVRDRLREGAAGVGVTRLGVGVTRLNVARR